MSVANIQRGAPEPTLLHRAVTAGGAGPLPESSLRTIQRLIRHGAHLTALNAEGLIPLFLAQRLQRQPDVLDLLTPLFWAALEGNLSLLQRKAITVELLSRPVCLPRGEDPQFHLLGLAHKATLLHWAAAGHGTDISAHIATAEFLIKEGNISIDTPDLNGRTPLHYATLQGFPQMVDYLIQQRATVNWRDVEGATALHRAALKGNLASVRSLMTAGASMYIQNLSGDLPIHWALDKNAQGDSLNVVREFLDQGIDPEYRHDDPGLHGRSLLDCARSEKRADVEKLLRDRIAEAHP